MRRLRPEDPTHREREVLELVWSGLTNDEISRRLSIAVKTVEAHRANLMRKFRAANTAQLLRSAITNGTLKVEASPGVRERGTVRTSNKTL